MMPTLHRGDILFSTNSDVKIEVKDIVLAQVSKYNVLKYDTSLAFAIDND